MTIAQFREFSEADADHVRRDDRTQGPAEHPVASVHWHEALAFCRWLRQKIKLPAALPSEAKWEKPAWGTGDRLNPWGNDWGCGRL
jgi:formylglycine-generating enzyme required for sulfatase activity